MTDDRPGWSDKRARHWSGLFLANMIVPFPIAFVITHRHGEGWFGALAAAAAVGASGLAVCGWCPRLGDVLIRGARALAFSQLIPVLHVGSLTIAVLTWFEVFKLSKPTVSPFSEAMFFGVALLAAIPLLFVALVVGGGHRLILGNRDEDDEPETDPMVPPEE